MSSPSLREERLPTCGNILLLTYGGLGDGVLMTPLVVGLATRLAGRLLIPETAAVKMLEVLRPDAASRSGRAPWAWRRIYDRSPSEIRSFVRAKTLTAVLSLRRDRFAYPTLFARSKRALSSEDVNLIDLCDGMTIRNQACSTVATLHARLGARLGIPPNDVGHFAPRTGPVALFPNCSVVHKQPDLATWAVVGGALAARGIPARLIPGVADNELNFAAQVADRLHAAGLPVEITPQPLPCIPAAIGSCIAVVSPDSFPIHLADAMGIPSFCIYLATDARMYGSHLPQSRHVSSEFYPDCPRRTVVGNCDAWERPCPDRPCAQRLDMSSVAGAFNEFLEQVDAR